MNSLIIQPGTYVPPHAVAFADASGDAQIVGLANPLPVGGAVTVSNLPAMQAVAGTVAVSNLPATTTVAGAVTVSGQVTPTYAASGLTPVTGAVAAGAQSGGFTPVSGRDFNLTLVATGSTTGGATNTAQVERRFAGDANWYAVISDAMRQSLPASFAWSESEAAVAYRVNVLTGAFSVRISQ